MRTRRQAASGHMPPASTTWDPTLDPLAITHKAPRRSPWTPSVATLVIASSLAGLLLTLPPPRTSSGSGATPQSRPSVPVTLQEASHLPDQPGGQSVPGGGSGRPAWAPVATPGSGGLGNADALPTLPAFSTMGDLESPVLLPGPSLALGGGDGRGHGMSGGSPDGDREGGTGGGLRGKGLRSRPVTAGNTPGAAPRLIPIHEIQPHYRDRSEMDLDGLSITIRILVAMDGRVSSAAYLAGEASLQKEAIEAALGWRFKPLNLCGFQKPQLVDIRFLPQQ